MSLAIILCLGQYEITKIATTFTSPPPYYHLAMMESLAAPYIPLSKEEALQPVPIKTAVFEYTGPSSEGYIYHLKSIEG